MAPFFDDPEKARPYFRKAKEIFDVLKSCGYQSYKFDLGQDKFVGPVDDSNEFLKNYYASYHDLAKL